MLQLRAVGSIPKPCSSHYPTPGLTAAFISHRLPTSGHSVGLQLISDLPRPSLKNSSIVQGSGEEEGALLGFVEPLGGSESVLCQLVARENWAGFSTVVLLPPSPPNDLCPESIHQQGHAGSPEGPAPALNVWNRTGWHGKVAEVLWWE